MCPSSPPGTLDCLLLAAGILLLLKWFCPGNRSPTELVSGCCYLGVFRPLSAMLSMLTVHQSADLYHLLLSGPVHPEVDSMQPA